MKVDDELLVITMEECAELTQACAKIVRFGYNQDSMDNLKQELGDVAAMISLMLEYKWITDEELEEGINKKLTKLQTWSSLPIKLDKDRNVHCKE